MSVQFKVLAKIRDYSSHVSDRKQHGENDKGRRELDKVKKGKMGQGRKGFPL